MKTCSKCAERGTVFESLYCEACLLEALRERAERRERVRRLMGKVGNMLSDEMIDETIRNLIEGPQPLPEGLSPGVDGVGNE